MHLVCVCTHTYIVLLRECTLSREGKFVRIARCSQSRARQLGYFAIFLARDGGLWEIICTRRLFISTYDGPFVKRRTGQMAVYFLPRRLGTSLTTGPHPAVILLAKILRVASCRSAAYADGIAGWPRANSSLYTRVNALYTIDCCKIMRLTVRIDYLILANAISDPSATPYISYNPRLSRPWNIPFTTTTDGQD